MSDQAVGGERQRAFGRPRRVRIERRIEPVKRRAIGADDLVVLAHVEEHVRMIVGGVAPTHMNSLAPISITGTPGSLWKWGTTCSAMGDPRIAARSGDFGPHHSEAGARCLGRGRINGEPNTTMDAPFNVRFRGTAGKSEFWPLMAQSRMTPKRKYGARRQRPVGRAGYWSLSIRAIRFFNLAVPVFESAPFCTDAVTTRRGRCGRRLNSDVNYKALVFRTLDSIAA